MGKTWSAADDNRLREMWGQVSIPAISTKLGRSQNAVIVRACRLNLGPFLEHGDYITLHQLSIALGFGRSSCKYFLNSWVENRGFPIHTKKRNKSSIRVVYLDEFWEWAEKNRSFLDFSKMEPLALGEEPEWVKQQRKMDYQAFSLQRKDPWTEEEDSRLVMLLKMHKYGYAELSQMMHRSAGAIQRRCNDLGVKERPVKANNRGKDAVWTENDFRILADGIRTGMSYTAMGNLIGKSEKAIRGKAYFTYLTENADKIRKMLGSGEWGDGAPVPTVKQAIHLSRTRAETKSMLEQLAGVLLYRTKMLRGSDYDRYFQRSMCMNWDDSYGECSAGCEDCDSCSEFIRIRPQYCVRCGNTFFERAENKRCLRCRTARKNQAARKHYFLTENRR